MYVVVGFFFVLAYVTAVCAQDYNKSFVDYYVNLIGEHNQKALSYKFPSDARMYEAADKDPQEYGEFDFIIVGAGTAGCIIANRLSEVSDWKILLLEAGTYRDDDLTGIPELWTTDILTKFDWGFQSVPQRYACQGNVNKMCFVPRGKGVGGSTLINGMAMTRGNKLDYERWSEILDDPNWNYENVLPYFKKSENFTKLNPYVPIDQSYHGENGLLHITESYPPQETSLNFLRGGEQLGYNITDYNGKQQLGFSVYQLNINEGKRYDFETAFLSPIKNRNNLVILDKSYVISVNISSSTKEVTGVTFTRENKTYIARNRKEVILSAGSISSPQILLLSGVGPEEHLKSLGIPVKQNLPVGLNLRDQTLTPLIFSTNITTDYESIEKSVEDFLKGQGTLTRPFVYEAVAFVSISEKIKTYPNVEYVFTNISGAPLFGKFLGWSDKTYEEMNTNVPNSITVLLAHLDTSSIGTVKLKSCDPFEYPLINSNILSDPDDVESVYSSIQHFIELTKTEAFRSMNVTLTSDRFGPCNHLKAQ